ncbi:hypothetical protein FJ656_29160, partial [Schumannella luteola]
RGGRVRRGGCGARRGGGARRHRGLGHGLPGGEFGCLHEPARAARRRAPRAGHGPVDDGVHRGASDRRPHRRLRVGSPRAAGG